MDINLVVSEPFQHWSWRKPVETGDAERVFGSKGICMNLVRNRIRL